jgi:hypothetical protein
MMRVLALGLVACVACTGDEPLRIELAGDTVHTFAVDGEREVRIATAAPAVVEAWVAGGEIVDLAAEQLAAGAPAAWLVPRPVTDGVSFTIAAKREVTLQVWSRGDPPPTPRRERSVAWFDAALLDDPSVLSFGRLLAAVAGDAHGGAVLDRWFRAFAAGPGAGRATFTQFLAEVAAMQGADPQGWNLDLLPFRVTGVHNRHDLATGDHCGELRVSVASTHPTFSPVHLIFLFRQRPRQDDLTAAGAHCRGTARRWAELTRLEPAAFAVHARSLLAETVTHDGFLLAESVELSISPWQWRQWVRDGSGGLVNPALFQTVDVARVNAPGPTRDAFLAAVAANADAIAARTWVVPATFRAQVAEVQPNIKAPLVDLSPLDGVLARHPELPHALGMIGCPRCHTDDADFVHTAIDRMPSAFYDRELDARTQRLDALARGEWPPTPAFGPLQSP